MADAVVIGAGPNGLVGANVLADEGWDVVVLEANDTPGGAVRTAEVTAPGFRNDLFSAFYPMAVVSPPLRALRLEEHGLRWLTVPVALANPTPDGPAAVLSMDLDETCASLDVFSPGDGDGWRTLYRYWQRIGGPLVEALMSPFPPVRAGLRLAAAIGPSGLVEFGRFAVLPVRRMADEHFRGVGGGVLLAGAALHADVAPEAAGSGVYGMLMCGLGQQVGFPVPEGGSQRLVDALVSRLESRGGQVVCNARVSAIDVRDGRAVGVRTVDGRDVPATRAVLADVGAPQLYTKLLDHSHLPAGLLDDLDRFEYGTGTVKVDWALSGKIPWRDPEVARAGTVHLADSMDHLSEVAMQLATGHVPRAPFLLIGQMTTTDPSRSPAGTESAWAYTHVPPRVRGDAGGDITGVWDERETGAFAQRIEARIEAFAPGFRELIIARHVFTPPTFEEADANLVGGDVNGGTAQLHQQLVFRPTPGLGRPETPIARLYLASASAHPGGGVHGAPGANAARAAIAHEAAGRRLLAVGAAAASLAAVQVGRAAMRRRR